MARPIAIKLYRSQDRPMARLIAINYTGHRMDQWLDP